LAQKEKMKYQEVIALIRGRIERGELQLHDAVPSIKTVALELGMAHETVVKAYKILKSEGLIISVPHKGFYVSSTKVVQQQRVYVLLSHFSTYQQSLFNGLCETFPQGTVFDFGFHHFNAQTLRRCIEDAAERYTSYVICPFAHKEVEAALELLPAAKVCLVDRYLPANREYKMVY